MRKILLVIALVATSSWLHGCGGGGPTPAPTPPVTTTLPTTTGTTTTTIGGSPTVRDLNTWFNSWNPDDATSHIGVVLSQAQHWEEDPGKRWTCNQECGNSSSSSLADCLVKGQLLNHMIATTGRHALTYPDIAGWVYTEEALDKIVKCSYAQDGGVDGRVNHGCGCAAGDAAAHPDEYGCSTADLSQPHHCPSACEDWNPSAQRFWDPTQDSDMFDSCHCDSTEKALSSNCFWKGPAFFPNATSRFPNELHQMAVQRNKHSSRVASAYTEVVIDAAVLEQEMRNDAKSVVKAFVVPMKANCGTACAQFIVDMRKNLASKYNFNEQDIAIVNYDVTKDLNPFTDYGMTVAV